MIDKGPKLYIIVFLLTLVGCASSGQLPQSNVLLNESTVGHYILIPGTDQYCEVDNDNFKITECVPAGLYSETEYE